MPQQTPEIPIPPAELAAVQRLLALGHGAVTTPDLSGIGIGTARIALLQRHKVLLRVGRSAFVDHEADALASPRERHIMRATAVARTWPPGVAVSHLSAALVLDLPLPVVPERIHGCRMGTGQHRKNDVYTIHTGYVGASASWWHGVEVLEPRFVIMGVAEELGRDAAVMAADAALHREMVTPAELTAACEARPNHPAHAVLERSIELVDARTESPGETRTRLLLLGLGFTPVPQVVIRDAQGDFIGRVDFLLAGTKVVVEFDGMAKYGSAEDLAAEKRRELRLQRAGYVVVRLVWADLAHPERIRRLLLDALATAA
ncbi:DUF559 domain-containing protein [Serinicoccus kebangsaanensis]|uniref:DUF559 domain-containing protein n=1 Tax=Serinicoccus kebangsaanensis TaxID=2602069 RepID=UPI00124DF2B5|nr:DUF559 domain-containing protein [Serinicoccus kebangsaanensis]